MAWRRKPKAGEKASPKKQRKGTAVAAESHSEDGGSEREEGAGAAPASSGFFGCYLLASINPKRKGATYIGFTVHPARRLRQHNGELTAGAWKTRRMRPVEMVLVVYGFPSMVAALQFEWAWQHPTVSLAVKEVAAAIKNRGGVKGKIALLYAMLNLPKWKKLPLVVQFVTSRHVVHKLRCPPLPEHMDCILAPLSQLRIKVDETAEEPPICDEPSESESIPPEPVLQESASVEEEGTGPLLDEPESGRAPASVPASEASPAQDRPENHSESRWADPLADWDWLDKHDSTTQQEGEPLSWTPDESDTSFSTWQVRKGARNEIISRSKERAAELTSSLLRAGEESTAEAGPSIAANDEVLALGQDRRSSVEGEPGIEAARKRCGRGSDARPDGTANVGARARGDSSCGATAGGRSVSTPSLAEVQIKDTVDLSDSGDEARARPSTQEGIRQAICSRGKGSKRTEQRPEFRPGIEVVILEDSPTGDKPEKPSKSSVGRGNVRVVTFPACGQKAGVADALKRTRKVSLQHSGQEKNQWDSDGRTIIDLDP